MARVWIEDRETHADYQAAMEKWQAAKREGSKRKPPGRWRVRWYGPDGKGKAQTFQKLPQAEAEVHAITARLDKGSYRDPKSGKAAVRVVAEEWFGSKRKIGRTTKRDYRDLLDNYVIPKWGDWQVAAIQWEDVDAWLTELESKPGKAGKKPIGPARIIKAYRVLSMVMKHAVFSKRVSVNPCHDHELPRPDDEDEHVYLTYDQLERLALAAGEYRLMILTLGYCGIRWAEASAVKVGRLQVPQRRIRIVQNYTDVSGHLALGPVKNHERRSVPLPRSFADELGTLARGRRADDLLFTAPEGGPLRYANFRSRIFDPAVKEAGLEGMRITPHKLRHTAASLAIAAGADVKCVQTMLGHKDAAMTLNVYSHLWPDRLDEVADVLDAGRKVALALADASLTDA
ncbi:tyrosine-type recombinase/integrase [Streptomyces sp. NPDC059165]|uniref:tyrosine-type recombinase/integrase n=1 Tax=Streptomyces sp. NPDC059165 TaxID=3346751 RepID=UPI00367423A8